MKMWMKTCFHSHENMFSFTFYANFHASVTLVFMKFSWKCRTMSMKLVMIYTILWSFCWFFNWEGAVIRSQIRPRKIPESMEVNKIAMYFYIKIPFSMDSTDLCHRSNILWGFSAHLLSFSVGKTRKRARSSLAFKTKNRWHRRKLHKSGQENRTRTCPIAMKLIQESPTGFKIIPP